MKKQFFFAMLSAIALTGAALFTGCSSTDDVTTEDINPTYDPTTNTVKANFSLALTSKLGATAKAGTRMKSDSVQARGEFNGIKDISLIPFDFVSLPEKASVRSAANINIPSTITANNENAVSGSYNYHFLNVTVPVGTGAFLFYGVSNTGNDNTSAATRFANGILTPQGDFVNGSPAGDATVSPAVPEFGFNLVPILTDDSTQVTNNTDLTSMVTYLTSIANAKVDDSNTWAGTSNTGLKDLYDKFITMKTGSTNSARQAIQDLYSSLYPLLTPLANAIKNAITTTYATDNAGTGGASTGTLAFTGIMANNFPQNIWLPNGAVAIQWNTTNNAFEIVDPGQYKSMDLSNPTKFVYPSSLYYFAKSNIKTSTTKQDTKYNTAGSTDWENDILTGYSSGDQVTNSTVDIALNEEINYAVGQLAFTVKFADGDYSTENLGCKVVYDRKKNEVVIDNTGATPAGTISGFPVTGVLIGGLRNLDWEFVPVAQQKTGSVVTNEFTVYDNALADRIKAGNNTASAINYTLVPQTDDDQTIYIALEMVNKSGSSFWGYQGIVPNDAKFYLVAKLDPTAATGYGDGTGSTITKKVFLKDYKTTVTLTIGKNDTISGTEYPNGLGAAYLTIPDLGTPAMRLGFSVDLTWNQGLIFNQDL